MLAERGDRAEFADADFAEDAAEGALMTDFPREAATHEATFCAA